MHVNKQMDLRLHLYYAMTIKREIKRRLNQQPKIQSYVIPLYEMMGVSKIVLYRDN